jgi:hypothetical protein
MIPVLLQIGRFDIAYILDQWAAAGVFAYVIPFLLIFAVVFGVLSATRILGGNKGVHAIIALAVGLLALQLPFVPAFFTEIFPRLGVGLAVLLTIIILMGLFIPWKQKGWLTAFAIIGALIALVVIISAFSSYTFWGSWWWQNYGGAIIAGVIILAVIGVIIASTKQRTGAGTTNDLSGFIPLAPLHNE